MGAPHARFPPPARTHAPRQIYMVARYITYPKSATPASPPASTHANGSLPAPPLGVPPPAGATVHCTAVSRLCAKIGRITIPPAVIFPANGVRPPVAARPSTNRHPSPPRPH